MCVVHPQMTSSSGEKLYLRTYIHSGTTLAGLSVVRVQGTPLASTKRHFKRQAGVGKGKEKELICDFLCRLRQCKLIPGKLFFQARVKLSVLKAQNGLFGGG